MTEISPQAVKDVYTRITAELGKVMVGQEAIIRLLLVSLFCPRTLPAHRRARPRQNDARKWSSSGPAR